MAQASSLGSQPGWLRQQVIWALVGWNFKGGFDNLLPGFAFVIEKAEDLVKTSETWVNLAGIGVPITVRQAQEKFGILPAEGDEPLLTAVGAGSPRPTPGAGTAPLQVAASVAQASSLPAATPARMAGLPHSAAARMAALPDADPASLQTYRLETETTPAWADIMDHIKQLVEDTAATPGAGTAPLQALRDALLAAYGDLPTDELTDIMGMAFAAADLAGRYDVTEDN